MKLLRSEEVAETLGVSVHRVQKLIREGLLPAVRLGRSIRVSPEALKAWIDNGGAELPGAGGGS